MRARYSPGMRSMEDPPSETREQRRARAKRFGAYLTAVATQAGFDVRPRQGGQAQLARLTGLNLTTVGRTLEGKTLPLPSQMERWASALGRTVREMLVESGTIPDSESGNQPAIREVPSAPLTPEAAADAWGITDPKIRSMLVGNIVHAIRLQQETDAADGRGAVARG